PVHTLYFPHGIECRFRNHTSKERLTMKNPDPNAVANAIAAMSNRLLDSNQFLIECHGRMIDCNTVLSDAIMEVHESMCAMRDQMACEKDQESFNNVILALSGAMVLWCENWEGVTEEIRADLQKSKALKDEIRPSVEGLI
ncbi:MAG: hypothetical protein KGQ60_13355, partial [Planctomycetes bacterium]|nr:hypothetical protein [Planctomycetota bacterium]